MGSRINSLGREFNQDKYLKKLPKYISYFTVISKILYHLIFWKFPPGCITFLSLIHLYLPHRYISPLSNTSIPSRIHPSSLGYISILCMWISYPLSDTVLPFLDSSLSDVFGYLLMYPEVQCCIQKSKDVSTFHKL